MTKSKSSSDAAAPRLNEALGAAIEAFYIHLDGESPSNVYEMVLAEVELPLLKATLAYTGYNQSKCAAVLGLSRGTLRKKLKQFNLL